MLTGLIILAVSLAVLDLVAPRFGADTRDGNDWLDRSNARGGAL